MSFEGYDNKNSRDFSGGGKMVADDLCSYNLLSNVSQRAQMLHSSHSQALFNSSPLSLALVCSLSLSLCVCLFVCKLIVILYLSSSLFEIFMQVYCYLCL